MDQGTLVRLVVGRRFVRVRLLQRVPNRAVSVSISIIGLRPMRERDERNMETSWGDRQYSVETLSG